MIGKSTVMTQHRAALWLAAFIAAIVVALGSTFMASAPAHAAGSDDPTPYSVTPDGIQLPDDVTFPDNGHVNIRTSQGERGVHFEAKCIDRTDAECAGERHELAQYIGKSFIPWSAFGLTGNFCVSWVQISMYNQHYGEGGQPAVCTTPPAPKKAKAEAHVTPPTCTGPSGVTFTIENATWDNGTPSRSEGSHSEPATGIDGALFENGTNKKAVDYTIEPYKPGQSTDPNGDCYVPPDTLPANPQYSADLVCGKVTVNFTNHVELGQNQTAEPAVFTFNDEVITVDVNTEQSRTASFPENSGNHPVTYGVQGEQPKTVIVETDCNTRPPTEIHPPGPTFVDKCGTDNDTFSVPAELVKEEHLSEGGDTIVLSTYESEFGTFLAVDHEREGVRTVEVVFAPSSSQYEVGQPNQYDSYELIKGAAVWKHVFTNEACPNPHPPVSPSPTPEPSETPTPTPSATPQPSSSPSTAAPAPAGAKPPSKGALAATGTDIPVGPIGGGIALLLAGLLLADMRRRQLKASK